MKKSYKDLAHKDSDRKNEFQKKQHTDKSYRHILIAPTLNGRKIVQHIEKYPAIEI